MLISWARHTLTVASNQLRAATAYNARCEEYEGSIRLVHSKGTKHFLRSLHVALPPLLSCFWFIVRVDDFTNVAKCLRSGLWPGRYENISRIVDSDVQSDFPVLITVFICVLARGHRMLLDVGVQKKLIYGHTIIICGGTYSSEYLDK